jgi:hypothetical protein
MSDENWDAGDGATRRDAGMRRPARPSKRALWTFAAIGLAVGLAIGIGLLVWQRVALLADKRVIQGQLTSVEESAAASADQVATLEARLVSTEATLAALSADNSRLSANLATVQAALDAASAKLAEAAKTLEITERTVSPSPVVKGASFVLQVKVKGTADKVQMKLVGTSPLTYSKVYNLTKVSTTSGVQTWKRTVTAPPDVGVYRYYATAYIGTKSFEMPGVSAWSFEVKAAP